MENHSRKLRETKSDECEDFRPRICTYGGRELTPYRLRTTSHSASERQLANGRVNSVTASHPRIGVFSSTDSLFSSFLPPKIDSLTTREKRHISCVMGRDSETGETDGMMPGRKDQTQSDVSTTSSQNDQCEELVAWKILVTVTLTFVLIGINWVAFPIFYVEFTEQFNASKSVLGWIGSLQNAGSQIIGLFVSAPVQIYGCRPVAFIGGIVLTVGTALSALSPNIGFLYFSYGITSGIGLGMVNLAAMVIVQQHFTKHRTIATAIAMTGGSVGQIFGPVMLQYLIELYGWRGAMLIYGGIMLHSVPFAISFTPVKSSEKKTDKSLRELMRKMFDFSILKEIPFTLFCFSFFLVKFNVFGFYMHLPSRVVHNGMDKLTAANLMMVTGIYAAISRLAVGFIGNLKSANRTLMYTIAVTVAGVATIFLSFSSTLVFDRIICGVFGACMGATMIMVSVVVVDLLGVDKIARSHGLFNVFSGVAGLLATPFSGMLFDKTQNYNIPFLVVGIMGVAGGLVAVVVVVLDKIQRQRDQTR